MSHTIKLSLNIALLFACCALSAQIQSDSIQIVKKGGTKYFLGGSRMTPKQLLAVMEPYPEAYGKMKQAKSNYDVAQVFGFVGGFMIGWPLGTAIGGGDPNWGLVGVGAGVLLISIPIISSYNKKAKSAVDIYNSKINEMGWHPDIELRLGNTKNGLGLLLKF